MNFNPEVMDQVLLDQRYSLLWIELIPDPRAERMFTLGQRTFIPCFIHPEFWADVELFRKGKYSHISERAKKRIFDSRMMIYNQSDGQGNSYSDAKALALLRHKALRDELCEQLGVNLDEGDELLEKPKPDWFIDGSMFTPKPQSIYDRYTRNNQ